MDTEETKDTGYTRCEDCYAYYKGEHKCDGLMKGLANIYKINKE